MGVGKTILSGGITLEKSNGLFLNDMTIKYAGSDAAVKAVINKENTAAAKFYDVVGNLVIRNCAFEASD
jgi:hypothetical protein